MQKTSSGPSVLEPRKKRERSCPFMAAGWKSVDYKDVDTLKRFMTERGKILPRRVTGVSARFQRYLTTAIKQARYIGLLPFVSKD
jgi:small subunit ribosomal protein S18